MKIKDICKFYSKSKIKAGEGMLFGKYPFYTSSNILSKYLDSYEINREGIILGTGGNASIHYCEGEFSVSTDCLVMYSNDKEIKSEYIYYYLFSNIHILEHGFRGAGLKHISKKYIEDIELNYIPNILEQQKIIEVIKLSRKLIYKREKQIEELDELVKSRFIEMFGDPIRNVKGWKTGKMNDVAPVVNYKGDFNKCKVWLLNLDMVESNTGNIIGYNYVTTDEIGNSTCTFDTTNILYSKLRPYLNKVVIPNEIGYATSEMVPLQPVRGVLNRYYLAHMLRNKSFVDYISEKVSGAKMPRVTMNEFRSFEVPIPPIELQNQFEDFVKQVEKLKFEMEKSLKELEDNFNSLMQRAFKGELFK